jgi:folylpolyglutamate synthase/dihydropteroate synthase
MILGYTLEDKQFVTFCICYPDLQNGLITVAKNGTFRIAPTFEIPEAFRLGLKNCWWPGRSQMICRPGWTLFVDGAHTVRSAKACMEWFLQVAGEDRKAQEQPVVRVLIFHCTGGRKPQPLLEQIKLGDFDIAIFCPNVANLDDKCFADQTSFKTTYDHEMKVCQNNKKSWLLLHDQPTSTHIFQCVLEAFQSLIGSRDPLVDECSRTYFPAFPHSLGQSHLQVLVCGSVLLVGAVFKALGPLVAPVDRL